MRHFILKKKKTSCECDISINFAWNNPNLFLSYSPKNRFGLFCAKLTEIYISCSQDGFFFFFQNEMSCALNYAMQQTAVDVSTEL